MKQKLFPAAEQQQRAQPAHRGERQCGGFRNGKITEIASARDISAHGPLPS